MDVQALVAAVAVCALTIAACSAGGSRPDSRAPVPPGLDTACPEPTTTLRFPEGNLPRGATRVRLCPGPPLTDINGDSFGGQIQGPADLLTDGVAELARLVNRQDGVEDDIECTFDEGPVLAYWFGYPNGDWRAVQFDSYGCNLLTVGEDQRRRGGAELATAFTERLMAQRQGEEAPSLTPPVSCPAFPFERPYSALAREDVELAAATWCVSPRAKQVREVDIPLDLVQRLNDDLWPGLPARSRPCGETVTSWLDGVTPWGDAVGYAIDSCGEIHPLHGAWVLDAEERHYITPELDAALTSLPLGPMVDHRS